MAELDAVRIGVVGCGYWGPNLIRNFSALRPAGAVMAMAADRDPARRRSVAERFSGVEVVDDAAAIIDNPEIDAVALATPVRDHFEGARRALEAGKHVLVEKPLVTTLEEASELWRLANEHDRVLMVGHTYEYAVAVNYIRNAVNEGMLGELTYIRSLRVNLGVIRNDVNVVWDLAPHDISIMLYVLGRLPVAVQAMGKARVNRSVEDIASITLDFGEDLMANIIVSWRDPQKVRQMTFVGDRQMLVYDDVSVNEKVRIFDKGVDVPRRYDTFGDFQYTYRYGDILIPMLDEQEPLFIECRHFVECCQLGKDPQTGPASGAAVTAVLEAAQHSLANNGSVVDLDEFVDGRVTPEFWKDITQGAGGRRLGRAATRRPEGDATAVVGDGVQRPTRRRAVVVDADQATRAFVADALTTFEPGFDVATAATVEDALEWVESFHPHLVVFNQDSTANPHAILDDLMSRPDGRHCRIVTLGGGAGDSRLSEWRHGALNADVTLNDLLAAVRSVFAD